MAPRSNLALRLIAPALALLITATAVHSATITIVNLDGAGEGFNDGTAAAPVGGNTGTTVGAQRLQAFQQAAAIWGSILPSTVTIRINANFDPLSCTATSAVLGSSGAAQIYANFAGALLADTWYPKSLADKLAGADQNPASADMNAHFNSNLGNAGCLTGYSWYYGFDHNETTTQIDLLAVLLHEFAHGLGFQTFTSGSSGAQASGLPDAYSTNLYDQTTGLHWPDESDAQRAASAINPYNLLWDGPATKFMQPYFVAGKSVLRVNAPGNVAADYLVGLADFGSKLPSAGITAPVVLAVDGAAPTSDACTALVNGAQIAGNIAMVDRGTCTFVVKVKACQDAGAIAVIVVDNAAGSPPPGLGGTDPTITIPAVRITLADGNTLKAELGNGLNATLIADPAIRQGYDANGRVMLYTPNPFQSGSSVSHWDVIASPNLLMEPAINPDLTSSVDLTRYLFEDIGWLPRTTSVPPTGSRNGFAMLSASSPNPFARSTTIPFVMSREADAVLDVYDVSGRVVKHLIHGTMPAGSHVTVWDGRDEAGNAVKSGVYFSHLSVGGEARSQRMLLVK